jgi:hypothetical protein
VGLEIKAALFERELTEADGCEDREDKVEARDL